jgi:hypothetical protein
MSSLPITGTVTGTGSAINVSLGFAPGYVKIWNVTDSKKGSLEWSSTMAAASGFKNLNDAYQAQITSNGISAYAGSTTAGVGFTIGADTDLNGASDVIHYIAFPIRVA